MVPGSAPNRHCTDPGHGQSRPQAFRFPDVAQHAGAGSQVKSPKKGMSEAQNRPEQVSVGRFALSGLADAGAPGIGLVARESLIIT